MRHRGLKGCGRHRDPQLYAVDIDINVQAEW